MKNTKKSPTKVKKRPLKTKRLPWRSARTFTVLVERDEDGFFVASIPALPGCHTQARSYAELDANVREAIELYLEVFPERARATNTSEFVGVHRVAV